MTLVVKCKNCSTIHKSPVQSANTKNEFIKAKEKSELFENMWKCPKCDKMSMYSRFDYGWQENEIKAK